MGAVYEVEHIRTKKRFALKWMVPELASRPEAVARFIREAQSACALEHPNVVQIFDVDQADGGMYSLMELLRGEPLSARMERGPIGAREVVSLLLPLLHGLQEAHERGVVHRDLKPENVFLVKGRPGMPVRPKILDFGLSKLMGRERASQIRLTNTGMVMGTPAYMSPEQALDAEVIDARADIYALGAMMYEALTGVLPFEASSIPSLLLKVVQTPPEPLRVRMATVPAPLEGVVLRCLAKKPEGRPQSAEALAFELCDALGLSHDHYAPGDAPLGPSNGLEVAPTLPAASTGALGAATHPGTPVPTTSTPDPSAFSTEATTVRSSPEVSPRTQADSEGGGLSNRRLVLAAVALSVLLGLLAALALGLGRTDAPEGEAASETPLAQPTTPAPRVAPAPGPRVAPETSAPAPTAMEAQMEAAAPAEAPVAAPAEAQEPRRSRTRRRRASTMERATMEVAPATMEAAPDTMRVTPRLEVGMIGVDDF